jgi:ATP-dependent RNA helicase RhlE
VHRIGRTGRAGAAGLAVTFVGGGNDARLLADIEKLIKTKIELEAVEFDEDQPDIRKQGRINDGRRMYHEDGGGDNGRSAGRGEGRGPRDDANRSRVPRAPRNDYNRPAPVSRDPFFDKPYEPTAAPADASAAPSWESAVRPTTRSISANIKPKRKVAALFKPETTA